MKNRSRTTSAARDIIRRHIYDARPERQAEREQTRREMALGMKIRRIREEAGLTQKQLAARIGTQPSAVSRIEDADYDGHSMDTLQKVARALGMLLVIDFQPIPGAGGNGAVEKM